MAHWSNPKTRKIGHHIYHLHMEGMTKAEAQHGANVIRKEGGLARVVVDYRLGRHDTKNRDNYYCIYYVHRRQK